MTVGGFTMPEGEEVEAAQMAQKELIPSVGERLLDPYSKRAEGYSMAQIRTHNAAVKRLADISRGVAW